MTQFHHGMTAREALIGKIPLRNADTNTIAMLAFADDADEDAFPLNTPVLVTSINRVLPKAGTTGNLRKNLEIIASITSPTLVVIRVKDPFSNEEFNQSRVIGTIDEDGKRTGLQALLTVKSVLGITPKIICVSDTESIDVANALGAICKKLRAYSYITPRDEDGEILQNAEAVSAYREMLAFREIELIWPEWTSGNIFLGSKDQNSSVSVGISPDLQYRDDWTEGYINWAIEVNGELYPTEIGINYSYLQEYLQDNADVLGITGEQIVNDDDSSAVYIRNITNTRKFVRLIPDSPYTDEITLIGNPTAKIDSEGVISVWLEANNDVIEPEPPVTVNCDGATSYIDLNFSMRWNGMTSTNLPKDFRLYRIARAIEDEDELLFEYIGLSDIDIEQDIITRLRDVLSDGHPYLMAFDASNGKDIVQFSSNQVENTLAYRIEFNAGNQGTIKEDWGSSNNSFHAEVFNDDDYKSSIATFCLSPNI